MNLVVNSSRACSPSSKSESPSRTGRLFAALLLPWMIAGALTARSEAAVLYWDADGTAAGNAVDGTGLGGTGVWDTVTPNWWDLSSDIAWPGITADTAVFKGEAGTITLGGAIQAGSLAFESDGYIITGGTLMLGGAATIDVAALTHATIRSDITGTSGLIKTGDGMLRLSLPNAYSGDTVINGGTLEVRRDYSLGAAGGIVLDGGTLRALGNEFYSTRDITIGAGGGTFEVTRVSSGFGSMRLAGGISGAGTLTMTGFGELRLDGDSSGFTGAFVVNGGIVRLKSTFDRGEVANLPVLGASSLTVRSGGDLLLDYGSLSTTPAYSIINENVPVHLEGGRMQFLSNSATGTGVWTQNTGNLFMDRGSSRLYIHRSSSSAATVWSFADLIRSPHSTISFDWTTSSGTLGAPGFNPRIVFNSIPTPVNDGIMGGWALVNLTNFATYDPVNGVAIATYTTSDITSAGATDNVEMSQGNTVITIGDTTINALKWTVTESTGVLEQTDGSTLTIDTGGILALGNTNKLIRPESGGTATLTANGGALYVHNAQQTITINSNIIDGDMATALVKTQSGNMVLNGTNTYSGGTYINAAGTVTTGSVAGRTYLGSGPVYVTRGLLTLNRQGATTSEEGYSVFEGGGVYLGSSSVAYNTPGDRFTIDATSTIGGASTTGSGLNSLTYVAGLVTAGGQAQIAAGATILHGSNSSAMGTGSNTIQGLPTDMRFYFGEATTQTENSGVTIGLDTPWKGLGTDRNTRPWDLGTITVNGSEFELYGLLAPNQNGEGQSAYTLALGNNSSGVTNGLGPVITGATPGPLTAYVTGGIVRLEDDLSIFGDTTTGSLLTFAVTPGATLEMSQSNAMGSGTGIAAIDVLAGGTLLQFYSSTVSDSNSARIQASSSAINGDVVVRTGGRFLGQNDNGLDGTGTLTFEQGSVIQINRSTAWTGPQVLPANGLITGQNLAIVRIMADNFGTAAQPTLTTYFDGTGIYEWVTNANAANPSSPNTPVLSLDGGLVINDAFDRNLDAASNGFIELRPGGAGGTMAATTGQFFAVYSRVELHGQTLTIGHADVVDGNVHLGDLRMSNVTSDAPGRRAPGHRRSPAAHPCHQRHRRLHLHHSRRGRQAGRGQQRHHLKAHRRRCHQPDSGRRHPHTHLLRQLQPGC